MCDIALRSNLHFIGVAFASTSSHFSRIMMTFHDDACLIFESVSILHTFPISYIYILVLRIHQPSTHTQTHMPNLFISNINNR